MVVIPDSSAETMNQTVLASTTVKSDGWRGYNRIKEVTTKHIKKIVPPKEASKVLPWVHTMISNAKRNFIGINHQIKNECLQNYLDEFCYKTNRRYFENDLLKDLLSSQLMIPGMGRKGTKTDNHYKLFKICNYVH